MVTSKASKLPIKSPSMLLSYVVALSSMLGGASIVHNIFKPNLVRVLVLKTRFCVVYHVTLV
jgi:hypothetical protein